MIAVADFFYDRYYGRYVRWNGKPARKSTDKHESRVNLLDARKWLTSELTAAHELLSREQHLWLWHTLSKPGSGLANAIRAGHIGSEEQANKQELILPTQTLNVQGMEEVLLPENPTVADFRKCFFDQLHKNPGTTDSHYVAPPNKRQVIEYLAWAIVVESALLNERLNEDIRKTATAKGCYCMGISERDLTFFLPESAGRQDSALSEEFYTAAQAFQEYVRCRWPIHVFAIDPREQDQNVADASARRRELQFALALGFVTGQTSARSMTQFSRELQTEVDTISAQSHDRGLWTWRRYIRLAVLSPGTGP